MLVTVELAKLAHIVPDDLVVRVKEMRTISVNDDPVLIFRVDVSTNMISPINDQNALTGKMHLSAEDRTEQTATNDKIIVLFRLHTLRMRGKKDLH